MVEEMAEVPFDREGALGVSFAVNSMEPPIIINPKVLGGKPVIRGTRIPVSLILNLIAHGYTVERVCRAYPNITKREVLAAIRYAQQRLDRELAQPLAAVRSPR